MQRSIRTLDRGDAQCGLGGLPILHGMGLISQRTQPPAAAQRHGAFGGPEPLDGTLAPSALAGERRLLDGSGHDMLFIYKIVRKLNACNCLRAVDKAALAVRRI